MFYIILRCVYWMPHARTVCTFHSIVELLLSSQYGRLLLPHSSSSSFFFRLNHLLKTVGCAITTGFALIQIYRCCECIMGSNTFFSNMPKLVDANVRSALYPLLHCLQLKDFDSFTSWMSIRLLVSAQCSPGCVVAVEVPNYNVR